MSELKKIIAEKDFKKIISKYSRDDICSSFNFKESMWVAKHLFFDDLCDDEYQQFALKLTLKIKDHFPDEWSNDCQNDIFLGELYSVLWCYDEEYECYKRAYDKLKDPPAALLLRLSRCNSAPGTPPITNEEAEYYLKKSAEKKVTYETALKMRTLYRQKEDLIRADYWDKLYEELQQKNIHADYLTPEVFNVDPFLSLNSSNNSESILNK
jgi:hypothetical protein